MLDDPEAGQFFQVVKEIRAVQPKIFVLENVMGLLRVMREVRAKLRTVGSYFVTHTILDPVEYGCPMTRRRVYFLGIHCEGCKSLGTSPCRSCSNLVQVWFRSGSGRESAVKRGFRSGSGLVQATFHTSALCHTNVQWPPVCATNPLDLPSISMVTGVRRDMLKDNCDIALTELVEKIKKAMHRAEASEVQGDN